jgi:hypothetical protein
VSIKDSGADWIIFNDIRDRNVFKDPGHLLILHFDFMALSGEYTRKFEKEIPRLHQL